MDYQPISTTRDNFNYPSNQPILQPVMDDGQYEEDTTTTSAAAYKLQTCAGYALCFLIIIALIFPIIIFLKVNDVTKSTRDLSGIMLYVEKNLDASLISSLQLAKDTQSCPANYQPLVLATWPGTTSGCYCSDDTTNPYGIRKGFCTKPTPNAPGNQPLQQGSKSKYVGHKDEKFTVLAQQRSSKLSARRFRQLAEVHSEDDKSNSTENAAATTRYEEFSSYVQAKKSDDQKCHNIYPQPARNLSSWGQSTICAHYLDEEADVKYQKDCPEGYRSCADYLCVKNGKACPVTSVKYTAKRPVLGQVTAKVLPLGGDDGYLVVKSEHNELPLLSLEVEVNEKPCLSEHARPEMEDPYPLLYGFQRGCGKYGNDNSSQVLTTDNEKEFYQDNGMENMIVKNLTNYEQSIKDQYVLLVARPQIGFKNTAFCQTLQAGHFKEASSGIFGISKTVLGCYIAVIAISVASFFCSCRYMSFSTKNMRHLGASKNYFLVLGATLVFVLNVIAYCIGKQHNEVVQGEQVYFQQLQKNDCFTSGGLTQAMTDFEKIPTEAMGLFTYVQVSLIATAAAYVSYLFGVLFSKCC